MQDDTTHETKHWPNGGNTFDPNRPTLTLNSSQYIASEKPKRAYRRRRYTDDGDLLIAWWEYMIYGWAVAIAAYMLERALELSGAK